MKRNKICSFIFAFTFTLALHAQILDVPYHPVTRVLNLPNAFLTRYYLPELENYSSKKNVDSLLIAVNSSSAKPLLVFNDCIYFSGMVHHGFGMGEDQPKYCNIFFDDYFPPSLRFHTDSTKNFVDSAFSIHFFPQNKIEDYTQPFYFRKYEVTNGEYRAFVNYVIDSIARRLLADNYSENYFLPDVDYTAPYENDTTGALSHIHFADFHRLNKQLKINWDRSTESEEEQEALYPIFISMEERYYNRREIDSRKLNYVYYFDTAGTPVPFPWKWKDGEDRFIFKGVINVYPDTSSWINDFPGSHFDDMTNSYFSNPAYANYPVVGITWNQARAFLNWKTIEEQKKLNAKGIKLKVIYDLPTEIEWEAAATAQLQDGKINAYAGNFQLFADHSWLTDLVLDSSQMVQEKIKALYDSTAKEIIPVEKSPDDIPGTFSPGVFQPSEYRDGLYERENIPGVLFSEDTTIEKNGKKYAVTKHYYYWSSPRNNFLGDNTEPKRFFTYPATDGYFFTAPANLSALKKIAYSNLNPYDQPKQKNGDPQPIDNSEIKKQLSPEGISFMGGNVSEWLNEDYADWRPAFLMRLKMLHGIFSPDAQLEYELEKYFDNFNYKEKSPFSDESGKLVRGANWYDERSSSVLGKNVDGMNAKVFANPDRGYCTVGFRYVVRVEK